MKVKSIVWTLNIGAALVVASFNYLIGWIALNRISPEATVLSIAAPFIIALLTLIVVFLFLHKTSKLSEDI